MKMINMILTNGEIYDKAINMIQNFNIENIAMPVAVCFSLEKNKETLRSIAQEIEERRTKIIQRYGETKEDGMFAVPEDQIGAANEELSDLLAIQQEVKIYTFKVSELKNMELTPSQMKAIMFMIDEGEEN